MRAFETWKMTPKLRYYIMSIIGTNFGQNKKRTPFKKQHPHAYTLTNSVRLGGADAERHIPIAPSASCMFGADH